MNSQGSIFRIFQHSEEFFESLGKTETSKNLVARQTLIILLFTLLYGVVMGSYNGFLQSIVTGIKIPCLISLSLLICLPALFVIQYMIGSTMSLGQMINIILAGFIVFSTIALSFSPIVIFFMITSDNYSFLKLLHVGIFTFSGIFAVKTIIDGLQFACEKKNIYPKLGLKIFKIWIVILAFVSSQLAWNLRPFVGSRDLPFELFRQKESNFYVAVIQSVGNLVDPEKPKQQNGKKTQTQQQTPDTNKVK
ncbi:MAG: hypothetical protein U0X39_11695 [Bacteroidales bacterium]